MNRSICSLMLASVVAACIFNASAQSPDKPAGFLTTLKKGQSAIVKEIAGRFEINVMDGALEPLTHKIIAVADDYVVVEDIAGVTETRVPVYSIKTIVRLKVPKN